MSLRLRLLVVVGLAIVALIAASFAIVAAVKESDVARISSALASNDTATMALARAYSDRASGGLATHDEEAQTKLRAAAGSVLGSVVETSGGFCWRDGFLVEERGASGRGGGGQDRGPPPGGEPSDPNGGPPRPPSADGNGAGAPMGSRPPEMGQRRSPFGPPPDVRALLDDACAHAEVGKVDRRRVIHTRTTILVAVTGVADGVSAFTIRAVPMHPDNGRFGWSMQLTAMAILTLAMVAVMVDAMFAVRRGATDLERTLHRLESDLRAEIPLPRAKEFAAIAERLRIMASHLADARERERALERRVSHETRLTALGRLVAGVAHEIRNPLTGVKLLLDGIKRRPVDSHTSEDVGVCLEEIARLDHVVTSLLGVARDARVAAVDVDLHAVADERIAASSALAASRDVTAETSGDGSALVERDIVIRVLDNLIRNAIEASPTGGKVEVRVHSNDEGATFDVIDRGSGIPESRSAELFEPFFTQKPGGTGLGLWLSRALAQARGGAISYAREEGRTRFTLQLPNERRGNATMTDSR